MDFTHLGMDYREIVVQRATDDYVLMKRAWEFEVRLNDWAEIFRHKFGIIKFLSLM